MFDKDFKDYIRDMMLGYLEYKEQLKKADVFTDRETIERLIKVDEMFFGLPLLWQKCLYFHIYYYNIKLKPDTQKPYRLKDICEHLNITKGQYLNIISQIKTINRI